MAISSTDKKEIEAIARKEVKDFFESDTLRKYEDKLIDLLSKEIKRGKLEGDIKELVIKMFREFYNHMWTNRSHWESRLKSA